MRKLAIALGVIGYLAVRERLDRVFVSTLRELTEHAEMTNERLLEFEQRMASSEARHSFMESSHGLIVVDDASGAPIGVPYHKEGGGML